ncbi:hypothetical protein B0H21DRAFT_730450 [Amylocystis lapponica]|nr:hypothetical protein B0H21DRAFT_730450 [Amylocystis lapponica]
MRFSTVAIVLSAAALPAMAAPTSSVAEALARRQAQGSGASIWGDLFKGAEGVYDAVTGNGNNNRELFEELARRRISQDASIWGDAFKGAKDVYDAVSGKGHNRREPLTYLPISVGNVPHHPIYLPRQVTDGSGASIWGDLFKGAEGVYDAVTGNGNNRREPLYPLYPSSLRGPTFPVFPAIARETVDGSGASIWGDLAKAGGEIIGDFTGNNNNNRRAVDASGASIWGDLAKVGGEIIGDFTGNNNNRRELLEALAARQTVDASGASIWGDLAKVGGEIIGDFTGNNNNNRRAYPFRIGTTVLPNHPVYIQ